jgi:hypothetical protein
MSTIFAIFVCLQRPGIAPYCVKMDAAPYERLADCQAGAAMLQARLRDAWAHQTYRCMKATVPAWSPAG